MNIKIEFIPASAQRYNTIGDWYFEGEDLVIKVSDNDELAPTQDEQMLIAVHELVEVILCKKRGITQEQVDKFDFDYNKDISHDLCGIEPGDHPSAPYHREHRFAMIVEHMLAHEMGLASYGTIK